MSKAYPPPDYHEGYSAHPGAHPGVHPGAHPGSHPPPPGPPASHISGGYQPHYHQATQHAPQNQGMTNTFAPTISQPVSQATNITVNAGGVGGNRQRNWTTQLCGCFEDIGGCMCVMFCPQCMAMTVSTRMGELFCLPMIVPQWMLALRVKLRAANNIEGGIVTDCCLTTFCPMCVLCQMKRELDNIDRRKPAL